MPYDMVSVINRVLDDRTLFQIQPDFAKNIITGYGRMGCAARNFGKPSQHSPLHARRNWLDTAC